MVHGVFILHTYIRLITVIRLYSLLSVQSATGASSAVSLVDKLRKPNPSHAACLSRLFPSSAVRIPSQESQSATRLFDPTAESANLTRRVQKKGGKGRARPYKLWVVVGANKFVTVPKAGLRRAMKRNGRVKRLEFSRHMSRKQVKNVLVSNFPSLRLTSSVFMKAKCDNKMEEVRQEDEGFPNGTELQTIASKESLYLIESSNVQVNETTHFLFHF